MQYYKMETGNGGMRVDLKKAIFEYLNKDVEWEKNLNIIGRFFGYSDSNYTEISEEEMNEFIKELKEKRAKYGYDWLEK